MMKKTEAEKLYLFVLRGNSKRNENKKLFVSYYELFEI